MITRYFAALALLSIGVCGFANAEQLATPTPSPQPEAVVRLRLTTSQHTFAAGQPILLKVEAVNISEEVIAVSEVVPWTAAQLVVARDGDVIAFDPLSLAGQRSSFPAQFKLQPGEAYAYRYAEALPTGAGLQFFYPLSNWGYPQTLPSGHYTIVALPFNLAGTRGGEWFFAYHQEASNTVSIDIRS